MGIVEVDHRKDCKAMENKLKAGDRIRYDDGRPGHRVGAVVLDVVGDWQGMTVQFDDRADTTYIQFSDRKWMDFISVDHRKDW